MSVAEVFPVSEFVKDEAAARGWSEDEFYRRFVAASNGFGNAAEAELAARMIWSVDRPGLNLGSESAAALGDLFGTSAEFWANVDKAWQDAHG